jgi:hypothetical protein
VTSSSDASSCTPVANTIHPSIATHQYLLT